MCVFVRVCVYPGGAFGCISDVKAVSSCSHNINIPWLPITPMKTLLLVPSPAPNWPPPTPSALIVAVAMMGVGLVARLVSLRGGGGSDHPSKSMKKSKKYLPGDLLPLLPRCVGDGRALAAASRRSASTLLIDAVWMVILEVSHAYFFARAIRLVCLLRYVNGFVCRW